MAEYERAWVHDDYEFGDVLSVMTQQAEKLFIELSMTHVSAHVWSKRDFDFYLKQGFVVMDEKAQQDNYMICFDGVIMLLAAILVVPLITMRLSDYGVVYKKLN